MAAIKKSVRLVDKTQKQCRIISKCTSIVNDVNWSGSLNALADEYDAIMEENKPELSDAQWTAFHCAYNGYLPSEDARQEARLLSWRISEGYQFDEQIRDALGSEEDAIALIEAIKSWSLTKQLSAIYHAKKYWTQSSL